MIMTDYWTSILSSAQFIYALGGGTGVGVGERAGARGPEVYRVHRKLVQYRKFGLLRLF